MIIWFEQELTLREIIALYAEVAGDLLGLGRPAKLARVKPEDSGDPEPDRLVREWYEGDLVIVTVDVDPQGVDFDNDDWREFEGHRYRLRCTIPHAPGLLIDVTSLREPSRLPLRVELDDCDAATSDRIRAVVARHAKGAKDCSHRALEER